MQIEYKNDKLLLSNEIYVESLNEAIDAALQSFSEAANSELLNVYN